MGPWVFDPCNVSCGGGKLYNIAHGTSNPELKDPSYIFSATLLIGLTMGRRNITRPAQGNGQYVSDLPALEYQVWRFS